MLIIPGWEHQFINYYKNLCMNNTQKTVLSRFKGTEITRNAALVKPKVGIGTRVNMTRLKSDFCRAKPVPDATTAINKMTNAEYVILEPDDDTEYVNNAANNELTKSNYYAALRDADT